jgi:hypothetical protein
LEEQKRPEKSHRACGRLIIDNEKREKMNHPLFIRRSKKNIVAWKHGFRKTKWTKR